MVSLYYDTPDLRCYWEAWRKVPSRRKLRVRVYGSADGRIAATSFIEIKHKVNGLGFKRRLQAELDEALDLVEGRQSAADLPAGSRRIVEEAQHFVREEGLCPAAPFATSGTPTGWPQTEWMNPRVVIHHCVSQWTRR